MAEFSNPFLRGMLGAQEAAQRSGMAQVQTLGGMLALQDAMEMRPMKQEEARIALERARLNQKLLQGLVGRGAPAAPAGVPPMAFGEGGVSLPGGGQGNVITGQTAPAPQQPASGGGGGAFGISPQIMGLMASGDAGLMAIGKAMLEQQKPVVGREGAPILSRGPNGQLSVDFYAPKMGPGIQAQFGPQGVTGSQVVPGYAKANANIAGAETGAQEAARAGYRLREVPLPTGGTRLMSEADFLRQSQPQAIPQAPRPGMMGPAEFNAAAAQTVAAGIPTGQSFPPERIRQAELQPNGGGMIPSANVLGTTRPPEVVAGAEASARERGKSGVEFETGVLTAGQKAGQNLTQLQILAPNLDKLPTGPLYPLMLNAAGYFKQFGIDVGQVGKDLGPAQAADAILKQFALKMRDPSSGGGMPGAMSDADREFLIKTLPNLSNTPDANRQLLRIMTSIEQRKIDEASIVNRMQKDNRSSNDIREALQQYGMSRPMFR